MLKKFTVRCVVEWSQDYPVEETHLYEERITLWEACNIDDAIRLAEMELEEYCKYSVFNSIGLSQAFELTDDEDNKEVFSLLRSSNLSPAEYLDSFFDTGNERQNNIDKQ